MISDTYMINKNQKFHLISWTLLKGGVIWYHQVTVQNGRISFRPFMIRAIEGTVTSDDIIQNHNKCIVHFLDIRNTTTTKEYLRLAWIAGFFGANNIYIIYDFPGHSNDLVNLKFPELFDFQRVHMLRLLV